MTARRILAVDVGTGTQDILLLEEGQEIENAIQLVLPAPTVLVARRIEAATQRGAAIVLTGVTMGGGPCAWAAEAHLRAGFRVYATPDAARTFDDDLERVQAIGVVVVASDEVRTIADAEQIELRDFMPDCLETALRAFGVATHFDVYALAAFDHGAAPPGYSDRRFRFDFLRETIGRGAALSSFAYTRERLPASLTRLQALGSGTPANAPLVLMDTGAAAVLGALEDPIVRSAGSALVVNVGNFHTLAFHLEHGAVRALFEHHTGLLDTAKLDGYLENLANGSLTEEAIFADSGHGAMHVHPPAAAPSLLAVTGPRRRLLAASRLQPYFAVPHGDMMLCGCFGLLRGVAAALPEFAAMVDEAMGPPADLKH